MKGLKEMVRSYRTSIIDRWNSGLRPDSIIPEAHSQRRDRSFSKPHFTTKWPPEWLSTAPLGRT
jgi:hypothetical protein